MPGEELAQQAEQLFGQAGEAVAVLRTVRERFAAMAADARATEADARMTEADALLEEWATA
ncbi:hypothetical protein KGQ19_34070 [Catenulispora sp. NL8]|uniref:Uncharacterized protein n=1 Tax=Catenulispora pinistramenti TaxID=2705254 RepID=A0ABS5L0S7_9ACTN|nr:hypothetical protein [Catenulispora pinistramenti]MBS2551903.1 hypothetical protein [Catenulispora pinistramenti]